ncbi:MAG TPA: hypothetical protein VH115_10030, partial [Solirubrobacteraceae bacterium]|nr:hypothetical protein [Solirubrobacteraceae bacterium]
MRLLDAASRRRERKAHLHLEPAAGTLRERERIARNVHQREPQPEAMAPFATAQAVPAIGDENAEIVSGHSRHDLDLATRR